MDWIDVNDELPPISIPGKEMNKVLIICEPLGIATGYYWGIENTKPSDPCKGWCLMGVTHWLPLSVLPKIDFLTEKNKQ
jgi:hypothetical protein